MGIAKLSKALHKAGFYLKGSLTANLPDQLFRPFLESRLARLASYDQEQILDRVNYYNKLSDSFSLDESAIRIDQFQKDGSRAYFLDMKELVRFFPGDLRIQYLFGDITEVPASPAFLKSRPITDSNQNSILLKLNKVRHYFTEEDPLGFDEKLDQIVWRGKAYMPWRKVVVDRYHDHPLCDIGQVDKKAQGTSTWRPFMSIRDQLRYKYILSIEGHDVATNLKWIMSSNSLCMMKKPRFETWFMEGRLEPGVHYVELNEDHSDLEDKVNYYNAHPEEAKAIVTKAREHAAQFQDPKQEELVSLLVMKKFFELSGQL
ncbi:glycosyl transferase family 90 [Marinospirillum perlucidum]|uniref:glycosyl transferase family 90 n=1 Tax=Marinospirillum perlucidum TaxID=1982602 RepID=UPI000DF3E19E|nr:glycosyl transferase family 90 [Marinospirillum perlucidum]